MKILIVKTSSLGDIIHAFACCEYLRKKFPESQIDWVVEKEYAALVASHPLVSTVIPLETKTWRRGKRLSTCRAFVKTLRSTSYDVCFDFQGNTKSAFVTLLAKAKDKVGFGKKAVTEWPNLLATTIKAAPEKELNVRLENLFLVQSYFRDTEVFAAKGVKLQLSKEDAEIVERTLKSIPERPGMAILVCPGSAWLNKQLPVSTWVSFLQRIAEKYHSSFLFIWGNEKERAAAQEIVEALGTSAAVADSLTLPQLQRVMCHMDLVMAVDSLPLHLAGTANVKTYGIFGPSLAEKFQPLGNAHASFQGECPYNVHFLRRCPKLRSCKTGACIREASAEKLFLHFCTMITAEPVSSKNHR